jgi:hypothetical protein
MKKEVDLRDVLKDVEKIKQELDERIEKLKEVRKGQRHVPGDEGLARVFPVDPPPAGPRAPRLGS